MRPSFTETVKEKESEKIKNEIRNNEFRWNLHKYLIDNLRAKNADNELSQRRMRIRMNIGQRWRRENSKGNAVYQA